MIKAKVKTQKETQTLRIVIVQSSLSSGRFVAVTSGSCDRGPTKAWSEAPVEKTARCVQATNRTWPYLKTKESFQPR